jgi:hypothetical protein
VIDRLTAKWNSKQCRKLAKSARRLLKTKNIVHQILAYFVDRLLLALGYPSPARIFVCELACRLPVPFYSKIAAAARIIQISGICLCCMNGRDLTECECMIDLLRYETKQGVSDMMTTGFDELSEIAARLQVPEPSEPASDR